MGARITGSGSFLPATILTNKDLESLVETSDAWIVQRTGIRTRHILEPNEEPSMMAVEAARRALEQASLRPKDVDLLVVATNFPDMICPGTAPFVADELGLGNAPFFDLKAGCTGFVYGLAVAQGLLSGHIARRVLLIGTEALSRVTDWSDRHTCVLFGDGAGAVILEEGSDDEGILGISIQGDPEKLMLLHVPAGGTRVPASQASVEEGQHTLRMEGSGVFRSAVTMMERSVLEALDRAGLSLDDVDWVIPHQANIRIIGALARRLGLREDQLIVNVDRVANTSTASIPVALDEALRDQRVRPGDVAVMTAFGAGVTYGAAVVRI